MTDLDGELERLRAEARHRLEGERELDEKLASYEKTERELREPAPAAAGETTDEEAPRRAASPLTGSPLTGSPLTVDAAEKAARETAEKVTALSTPKLLVGLVVLVFGAWIIKSLIGPIVALGVLAILGLLGYRFVRWLSTPESERDDRDDD